MTLAAVTFQLFCNEAVDCFYMLNCFKKYIMIFCIDIHKCNAVVLFRSGISNKLNDLKVLHVTGTKGKGSTCAFCESILRHNGLTTGFFSSPHLLEVRERIKVNGSSISKTVFASHFWELYETLYAQRVITS